MFDIWNLVYAMRRWWEGLPKRAEQIRLVDVGVLSALSGRANVFPQSYEFANCSAAAMLQMYVGGLLYLYTMLNAAYLALQGMESRPLIWRQTIRLRFAASVVMPHFARLQIRRRLSVTVPGSVVRHPSHPRRSSARQ